LLSILSKINLYGFVKIIRLDQNFQFYPRSTVASCFITSIGIFTLSILSKINWGLLLLVCKLSFINFQFYPRSTTSLLSSTRCQWGTFNSIQDQRCSKCN